MHLEKPGDDRDGKEGKNEKKTARERRYGGGRRVARLLRQEAVIALLT